MTALEIGVCVMAAVAVAASLATLYSDVRQLYDRTRTRK